jgi:hypothetical protein
MYIAFTLVMGDEEADDAMFDSLYGVMASASPR